MKIAIDIRSCTPPRAGKGNYTLHLVKELLKLSKDKKYILLTNSSKDAKKEFGENAKIIELKSKKSLFWHFKAAKYCKDKKIDLYFSPTSFITPLLVSKSTKVVTTVHDLVVFKEVGNHNLKAKIIETLLFNLITKRSSLLLPVSQNTEKDLVKKFPNSKGKTIVVNCSASVNFKVLKPHEIENCKKESNLPGKYFLAVGTISPRKNYLKLIKAFSKLSKTNPKLNLIIVGSKGWSYKDVFALVSKKNLHDKVHFLNHISEESLICLYNCAEGLVFPSLYEGFGIPPLEAMKCSCPVICSNNSSLPEVVGDAALQIDPNSESEIEEAMKKILTNHSLRSKLIKAGHEREKNFSWSKSAKKLESIFSNQI